VLNLRDSFAVEVKSHCSKKIRLTSTQSVACVLLGGASQIGKWLRTTLCSSYLWNLTHKYKPI